MDHKHASELTGVPVATLRAWERRYALVAPARTDSTYRLYDDASLQRITAMHALVESGWSPRQAAEEVRGRRGEHARPSARTPLADGSTDFTAQDFVAAAGALDVARLDAILDEAFTRGRDPRCPGRHPHPGRRRRAGAGWAPAQPLGHAIGAGARELAVRLSRGSAAPRR